MTPDPMPPEWKDVSRDPDPIHDLGYEMIDLEVFEAEDGADQYMFLPGHEEMLADEAFIVAAERAVCSVEDRI